MFHKARANLSLFVCSLVSIVTILLSLAPLTSADSPSSGFSVLITPSPIVTTVNPGKITTLQLKILNNGSDSEDLNMAPKGFSVNDSTGQVKISSSAPSGIDSWISFSEPNFTIASGQWFTENINLNVPKDAGFSYYFVLSITKRNGPVVSSGRTINASVDDFVLLNVNRPGATESLNLVSFKASRKVYQWLPATFTASFKNTGNTIIAPSGNIFIKRSPNSKTSIDTLTINGNGGYILPGSNRIFSSKWSNGFPAYVSTTNASGAAQTHLSWSLNKSSSFRFGKYSATLVAIYDNGTADVPLTSSVSFWVLPWVLILIVFIVLLIFAYGFWSLGRRVIKVSKRKKNKSTEPVKESKDNKQ
jgi:hypothetical protein